MGSSKVIGPSNGSGKPDYHDTDHPADSDKGVFISYKGDDPHQGALRATDTVNVWHVTPDRTSSSKEDLASLWQICAEVRQESQAAIDRARSRVEESRELRRQTQALRKKPQPNSPGTSPPRQSA
jgi:hypothetical protein